jgi:phage gpG-like protein
MIQIDIDITGLRQKINAIAHGLSAPNDLMDSLAETLFNEVKNNFAAQGRPAWDGLKTATLKSKARRGVKAGIGFDSGDMFRSIYPLTIFGAAMVTTASPYAPFFNNGTSKMAARPFMVLPDSGARALSDAVADYIEALAR